MFNLDCRSAFPHRAHGSESPLPFSLPYILSPRQTAAQIGLLLSSVSSILPCCLKQGLYVYVTLKQGLYVTLKQRLHATCVLACVCASEWGEAGI